MVEYSTLVSVYLFSSCNNVVSILTGETYHKKHGHGNFSNENSLIFHHVPIKPVSILRDNSTLKNVTRVSLVQVEVKYWNWSDRNYK